MTTTEDTDLLSHLKVQLSNQGAEDEQVDIFDYFPSIIYIINLQKKKIKYLNPKRFSHTLGFSAEDINAWEDDLIQLIFKDDHPSVLKELEKLSLLKDEERHCYDCRMNHKQGDFRYFRTKGTILRRTPDGQPETLLFISEDITEKTKSTEELLALKSLIDDTEHMLQFGSWSWQIKTGKVQWTDGVYNLLGYDKKELEAEVSNAFYLNHVHEQDRPALEAAIENALEHKQDYKCTYRLISKDQKEKIVAAISKVVVDESGEVVKILGTIREITGEMKIQRDLLHYKEMTLEKEEFLNQGSWEWNINDGITSWSPGMYRLFGYDPDTSQEDIDITKDFLHLHLPEEARKNSDKWKILLRDKINFTRETSIITSDGARKQLETYAKVIHNHQGEIEKVIGTTRDVTPLRKYEKSLEEKIQELNRSNKELEEFAYIASHDLQEPLRKLTTFSERLQAKFSDQLGQDGLLYLDRIGAATANMRVLIENLLEFSRTARSTHLFNFQDLGNLLDQVKADLELKIEETGTLIMAQALPAVEVIPSQIKQLFDNLINNSIKFRKNDKQCKINIDSSTLSKADKDSHHLPEDKNYFKIVVRDNGIGFEKEYQERIFQIFQRLHGKSEYPGSGIGLAICKKIIENHKGIIYAEGEPEQGAAFTIILPERQIKSE